jgi:hypothetical protein
LNKKLAASLTIAIFLLSTIAVFAPVQAHFTLGENVGNYPYTVQNFDPHVPGVIGYVWPGGGENSYLGSPTAVSSTVGPGYTAPYPVNALTAAGVYNPSWTQNLAQLDGHEYSPSGAIVVNSKGDLIFALNATNYVTPPFTNGAPGHFDSLSILIPPEFTIPYAEQVVTTITNNYANIQVDQKVSVYDRYAPGWHLITISCDQQNPIQFTTSAEWYYVRINGVTAPSVAGKYFFKMFLYNGDVRSTATPTPPEQQRKYWVPTQNWPVLLVKGELDPAIITGTIRYGGYNSTLYGTPIQEAGMVKAVMTSKLDPYTGAKLTGPLTDAKAYFNGTFTNATGTWGSNGHYELEGVAPGIYDIYAEAAGYPQALIAAGVQVLKGQSLHFDGYLNPGPVIHGDVYSKHSFGAEPWPYNMYIKIELYDKPTQTHVPNSTTGPVSWSPLPCVAEGQNNYLPGADADTDCTGDPRTVTGGLSFPWHEWQASMPWETTPTGAGAKGVYYSTSNPGTDPQGVGPAQKWYVVGNGVNDKFHYEFGAKGMFGAPRDLDGHVPQQFATWVNGLTAGRYYARAWVFRYVQSALDGSTFQEYSFQVQANEWAGDISIPIDLRISSWINKTVHFHNNAGTLSTDPVETGATMMVGKLIASTTDATMYAYNLTSLTYGLVNGAWLPKAVNGKYDGNGNAFITFYGLNDTWLGQNYGIPAGTYKPQVFVRGYIQQTQDLVSVTLSGTPITISNHLYRGVGFNVTVYSIDWERPRVNRNWVWPGEEITLGLYDGKFVYVNHFDTSTTQGCGATPAGSSCSAVQKSDTYWVEVNGTGRGRMNEVWFGTDASNYYVGGSMSHRSEQFAYGAALNVWKLTWDTPKSFDSGQYSLMAQTYGYIQNKDYTVYANKGQIADMKLNLIIGVNMTLDILFKKEKLISGTPYNMSARVRIFDDSGRLVATWMSSEGVYVTGTGTAIAAYHTKFATATDLYSFGGGLNYLPGGINLLRVNTAGFANPDKLWVYPYFDGTYGDPVFTPKAGSFVLDNWPSSYWSIADKRFPNMGILGAPDYTGGWTAEVDFVNWYLNDTTTRQAASDSIQTAKAGGYYPQFYQPVPGLLMGESFHIIPGTQARTVDGKSTFSWTEAGALDPYYFVTLGGEPSAHSMAPNHLGPYSQQGVWTLTNAPLSGETSAIWEVDLNGYISGTALAFTWSNEFRSISWYTVNVQGAGNATFNSYTSDGIYEFYLIPGTYTMTISGPGYKTTPLATISVTSGQTGAPGSGNDLQLPQSNIPVPEFSGIAVVALSALAASLYLLRRRSQ